MRKIFLLMMTVVTALFLGGCGNDDAERYGSIFGNVTDVTVGEPMRNTGVELFRQRDDGGFNLITRTVTGNDGQFEFQELVAGHYRLNVVANGYQNTLFDVEVSAGRASRMDMQLHSAYGLPRKFVGASRRVLADGRVAVQGYVRMLMPSEPRSFSWGKYYRSWIHGLGWSAWTTLTLAKDFKSPNNADWEYLRMQTMTFNSWQPYMTQWEVKAFARNVNGVWHSDVLQFIVRQ